MNGAPAASLYVDANVNYFCLQNRRICFPVHFIRSYFMTIENSFLAISWSIIHTDWSYNNPLHKVYRPPTSAALRSCIKPRPNTIRSQSSTAN